MERVINKSYSTIYILKQENHFQKDSPHFSHRKLTLKIGFLQFSRGQKDLEVIDIQKLFDYKLSMGKRLPTVKCYA